MLKERNEKTFNFIEVSDEIGNLIVNCDVY